MIGMGFALRHTMSWISKTTAKTVLQVVGWGCFIVALTLLAPNVGEGTGDSHNPGADTVRQLLSDPSYRYTMLSLGAFGIVVLLATRMLFGPKSDPITVSSAIEPTQLSRHTLRRREHAARKKRRQAARKARRRSAKS